MIWTIYFITNIYKIYITCVQREKQIYIYIILVILQYYVFLLVGHPVFFCTGIVRIALSNMDREVRKEYQVVIQAKDMAGQMGGLSGTSMVNVTLTDVNDSPPRFAYSKISLNYKCFYSQRELQPIYCLNCISVILCFLNCELYF